METINSAGKNQSARERIDAVSNRIARSRVPPWKRILDCTLILAAAPVWLPVGALVAAWVKLVSSGPVLFRQERIGHLGARFFCLKFRTMKENAAPAVHRDLMSDVISSNRPMKKLDAAGDSRLIPGGLWVRALGLDELPQIFNVLRGDMSLVGPRPPTAYEYALFQPCHRRRCQTLPGLTGLWQVNGKNRTTFGQMIELDLDYIENQSPFLDLKILAATPLAILLQLRDVRAGRKAAAKARPGKAVPCAPPQTGQRGRVPGPGSREPARGAALNRIFHIW